DSSFDDIFELQDQVASGVVGVVEPRLRLAEMDRATRKPTESLDAYDLYLRAVAQEHKMTREGFAEAVRLAHQALELNPVYAHAMARIAGLRLMQLTRHWIADSGPEVDEAIRMARQAIAAARSDPDVLRSAGYSLAFLAGENDAALRAIDRAISLNR